MASHQMKQVKRRSLERLFAAAAVLCNFTFRKFPDISRASKRKNLRRG